MQPGVNDSLRVMSPVPCGMREFALGSLLSLARYEVRIPTAKITQSGATLPLHVASQPLTSDATLASSTRSSAIFALIAPRCFAAKVLVSLHGEHRWPASQTALVSPMRVTMTAVKAPSPPRNGVDARRYSDER